MKETILLVMTFTDLIYRNKTIWTRKKDLFFVIEFLKFFIGDKKLKIILEISDRLN